MYTPVHIDKGIPLQKPNGNWPMVCGSSFDRLWCIYMFVHVLCGDGSIVSSLVFTSGYHRNGDWRMNSAVCVFNLFWFVKFSMITGWRRQRNLTTPTPILCVVTLPLEYSKTCRMADTTLHTGKCWRLTMCPLGRFQCVRENLWGSRRLGTGFEHGWVVAT